MLVKDKEGMCKTHTHTHTKRDPNVCEGKQIKADLELRHFNRLLLPPPSENNKQHSENYKGYTPQN